MTRAQRRRAEREAKKGNKVVEQRITGAEESIRIALLKENIARDVDRKLYDKYYQKANKDAVDNIYSIILTSLDLPWQILVLIGRLKQSPNEYRKQWTTLTNSQRNTTETLNVL